ncbi:ATP-binding protein [Desulfobacterales bacterium HSG2]|nr:ATP-binding protein [Desulfobacterales bacterium HSG2]
MKHLHQTSNIKHQASSIKHQASNIKHQASSIKHQTSNIKHQASKEENMQAISDSKKPPAGKKLPIGIQAFETMRERDYLYVDKTRHIHRMVTEGMFYFLSRPRRFGKSLLVSALKCLFQGRKELFEGLWIAGQPDCEWKTHPVIVIDFNEIPAGNPDELRRNLTFHLGQMAEDVGISLKADIPELQFKELILNEYKKTGMPVAVFIDEYDKPIIEHLGKGRKGLETAKSNRDILKSFFGVLKGASVGPALRFVFLTGISRFSKVSVFSELNNLDDISMNRRYADMLGYTREEIETCFTDHIGRFAEHLGWPRDRIIAKLERQYDGYRFSERDVRVCNPFSVLKSFSEFGFGKYWFETGTPTFLIRLLDEKRYYLPGIEEMSLDSFAVNYDIEHLRPEPLLFQTGYVTIRGTEEELYLLGYPNQEVRHAFANHLLIFFTGDMDSGERSGVARLAGYLRREDFEGFFETISAIFSSVPYDIQTKRDEAYYHTLFYLMISASGTDGRSSVLTSRGRIDLVVTFPDKLYIIEFKCNRNAKSAIRQIRNKGYAEKYRQAGRKIILMGINFSTEKRNVAEWKVVPDRDEDEGL